MKSKTPGRAIALLLLCLCTACVSKPPGPMIVDYSEPPPAKQLLFPYLHYRHLVTLDIKGNRFSFEGIASSSPEKIELVALSPLQVTLLKIAEDRKSGRTRFDFFDSRIERHKDRIAGYYELLRQLFNLELQGKAGDEMSSLLKNGATAVFTRFRQNIPRHVEITDPRFKLTIEVEVLDEENP